MGLWRHSRQSIDVEGPRLVPLDLPKQFPTSPYASSPNMPDFTSSSSGRRRTTMAPQLAPLNTSSSLVAPPVSKRKSFTSLFRSWRRDDSATHSRAPPPIPPTRPAERPGSIKSAVPPSPTSSVFSTQTAPAMRFPGPGVCSTLPPPRFSPAHGPGGSPSRPMPRGSAGYPHTSSTSSLVEHRPPLVISAPIPGVGDVPAHYKFRGERVSPVPEVSDPRLPDPPSPYHRHSALPTARASVSQAPSAAQAADARLPELIPAHNRKSSHSSTYTPAPQRPHRPVGVGLGGAAAPPPMQISPSPRAPPRPQHRSSASHASSQASHTSTHVPGVPDRNEGDAEFIDDTEVAALITEAHFPPKQDVIRTRSKIPIPPRPRTTSLTTRASPSAADSPASGSKDSPKASPAGSSTTATGGRERSVSIGRPSSLLSNVSWASVGPSTTVKPVSVAPATTPTPKGRGASMIPLRIAPVDTSDTYSSQQVEALAESPIATTASSIPDSVGSASTNPSPIDIVPSTRPLSVRPRSVYSTTFGEGPSPASSFSSFTGPEPAAKIAERPSTPTRDRDSALELTNARLQAELHHTRSEASLRAPRMSINRVSTGAVGNGPLSSQGHGSRMSYRVSQMTVRDERRSASPESPRPDSRASNASTGPTPATGEHSVPALLAEIESLKQNGARLQAELFAVRSQVNLLFPPTPAELAEKEALEALEDLEVRAGCASAASSPSKRRSRPRHHSRTGSPQDESDSAASTPSSSTSETWPVTPVMNNEWCPPDALDSSIASGYRHKMALQGMSAIHDSRHFPVAPKSRIPIARASGAAARLPSIPSMSGMSDAPPPADEELLPDRQPMAAPPPRPPRAARRSNMLTLPPGAADAATPGANLHSHAARVN